MIPKIIHYCWFGGNPLPDSAKKCIASWKKFLPDYEIKEWNESNFDVNMIPYVKEAYQVKKFAFVSDFARFYILYKYGGLYFDTDVEIVKSLDFIISKGAFMGCEHTATEKIGTLGVNPGLGFGMEAKLPIIKEIIEYYNQQHYILSDGTKNTMTVVDVMSAFLEKYGLELRDEIQKIAGITVYPKEYFCPKDFETGKLNITSNTYSIHHFDFSWGSNNLKRFFFVRKIIKRLFGDKATQMVDKVVESINKIKNKHDKS